jgi:hypothetical protein
MSNDIDVFKSNPLVAGGLFDRFMDSTKKLVGSGSSSRRISLKGSRFRLIVGGEQISVSKEDTMNVIVVDAANVARTYYEGTYDPEKVSRPVCWSHDTNVPAPEVPADQRQATHCAKCPMNIKGSGQGNSRACRFSQRMAVMLEGELDKIYQLQIPAASIFGQADGNKMPLQAYAKYLAEHKTPIQAVVTAMYFDENSESPKLFFKPARMVDAEETEALMGHIDGEEVKKAITLTVSQSDRGDAPAPDNAKVIGKTAGVVIEDPEEEEEAPKPKPKKAAPVAAVDEDEDDEVEEPKVVAKKAKVEPQKEGKLAGLMADWDDE